MTDMADVIQMPARDTVQCSCGRRWFNRTRKEADKIAFEHDDSPFHRHVVSSLLFVGSSTG